MSLTLRETLMKGAREMQCYIIITIIVINAGQGLGNYSWEKSYLHACVFAGSDPATHLCTYFLYVEEKK